MSTELAQAGTGAEGNTKPRPKARSWVFTWNNYEEKLLQNMLAQLAQEKYIMQEETGESGTKHIQGMIQFRNARHFDAVKKLIPQAHWEVCKAIKAAVEYCQKTDTRTGRQWAKGYKIHEIVRDPISTPYKWQQEIMDLYKTEPDDRKVYWYYDKHGGAGKSALAKHMALKGDVMIVGGYAKDIKFGITSWLEDHSLRMVIIDIPRSAEGRVSYDAIECIKNGAFFCSKYESKQCLFNPPHLVVLSNDEPQRHKLSKDRWVITDISLYTPGAPPQTPDRTRGSAPDPVQQ